MTFLQAKDCAKNGTKVCHKYFTDDEYITMKGEMIIFEDGFRINANQWIKGRKELLEDWSLYIIN